MEDLRGVPVAKQKPEQRTVQVAGAGFLLGLQVCGYDQAAVNELRQLLLDNRDKEFLDKVISMVHAVIERYPNVGSGWTILWLKMKPVKAKRRRKVPQSK